MCRETGPSPSHCSLGAGWDAAGGGGEGGFSQHLAGERLVAVCDGARDAVKFQETGRIGGHGCSFQLANSAPPLSVTDSAIAPSACQSALTCLCVCVSACEMYAFEYTSYLPSWEIAAIDVELWCSSLAQFLELCRR